MWTATPSTRRRSRARAGTGTRRWARGSRPSSTTRRTSPRPSPSTDQVAAGSGSFNLPSTVAESIVYVARWIPLGPGDVIMSGAPNTFVAVNPGDTVEITLDGIGTLTNPSSDRPRPTTARQGQQMNLPSDSLGVVAYAAGDLRVEPVSLRRTGRRRDRGRRGVRRGLRLGPALLDPRRGRRLDPAGADGAGPRGGRDGGARGRGRQRPSVGTPGRGPSGQPGR